MTDPKSLASFDRKLGFVLNVLEAAEKRRDGVENKASILLASNAILLTAITSFGFPLFSGGAVWSWLNTVKAFLAAVSLGGATISSCFAIQVIAPLMKKRRERVLRITVPEFNIFFSGKIAERESTESYMTVVESLTDKQIFEQLVCQAYRLSRLVMHRYKWLLRSLRVFLLAVFAFVLLTLLSVLI